MTYSTFLSGRDSLNRNKLIRVHPIRYHIKKGSQQRTKAPMMMPRVRAALCSRRIFWRCLSLVGVDCVSVSPLSPPITSRALRSPALARGLADADCSLIGDAVVTSVEVDGLPWRVICSSVTSAVHALVIVVLPLTCSIHSYASTHDEFIIYY